MVCNKCEKKLAKLICPDKWKEGSTNGTIGKGGRALATNTLAKKSSRYTPYSSKCEICKSPLHQQGKYCHPCAYGKALRRCHCEASHNSGLRGPGKASQRCTGLCSMCGRQILDTKGYKQSTA